MRTILFLTLLLSSYLSFSQARITILTYNVFHGEMAGNPGKPSLDSIASFINGLKPDFVLLQEVDSATERSAGIYGKKIDFVKELAQKTGMYGYFGKAMDYDGGGYGEALLASKPHDVKVAVLPSPAGGEPRSLIYTNTRLSNGQNIIVGGTHLCHEFNENRLAQVEQITSVYKNLLVPSIVCGDFNVEMKEEPYQVMMNYWKDAAIQRQQPLYTYPTDMPSKRIDYAFLTKRGNWRVVKTETFPLKYSDHLPLMFTIELTISE